MEELQDAIEDAQYMDAMVDPVPRPSRDWQWKTQPELENYINKLKQEKPSALDIEVMCQGSLGLYLFMKFCRLEGSKILAEFIIEVAHLRTRTSPNILPLIRKIISNYILDESRGNLEYQPGLPSLVRVLTPPPETDPEKLKLNYSNLGKNALNISGDAIDRILHGFGAVKAVSNSFSSMAVHCKIFDELDAIVFNILKERHLEAFKASPDWNKYFQFLAMTTKKLNEDDDFMLLRMVGRGGFGQVNACKKATTGKLYAMKMMSKKRIKLKKAEKMCLMEREIMTNINSPYVVCLKYSFSTVNDLYLVLDLMIGGDLGFHLSKKVTFSVKEAKFYAARVLLGIAALHDRQIVYRDLKPENILMDVEGYTKISDLGLACKMEPNGITGACGTRGYWAPDMLRKTSEGKRERYFLSVDWFSYGCVIYEFLVGTSPFRTEKAKQFGYDLLKNSSEKPEKERAIDLAILEMEPDFSMVQDEQAVDLMSKLLAKNPKERLGNLSYHEIIEHPWFSEVKFDTLNSDPPPMKPGRDINMAPQSEIGYFSDAKEAKKVKLDEADQKLYAGWDFVSMPAYEEEIVEFLTYEEAHGPCVPMAGSEKCCTLS